jgi:hypothetical protein
MLAVKSAIFPLNFKSPATDYAAQSEVHRRHVPCNMHHIVGERVLIVDTVTL